MTITDPQAGSIVITRLHVKFTVTRSLQTDPNEMKLEIENMSPEGRAFLARKGLRALLDVGWEDTPQQRLFTGDITWAFSRKIRTGWMTTVEAGDGTRKMRHARLAKSFRKGTSALQALEQLAAAMELTVPRNARDALARNEFLAGLTVQGPASREITRLLGRVGLGWSIQDGQIQILGTSEVRSGEAVSISQSTGMIGSPHLAPPADGKKKPVMTVDTLIDSRLVPGVLIALRSLTLTGNYKLTRVQHNGDNKTSPDWTSAIEAEPL